MSYQQRVDVKLTPHHFDTLAQLSSVSRRSIEHHIRHGVAEWMESYPDADVPDDIQRGVAEKFRMPTDNAVDISIKLTRKSLGWYIKYRTDEERRIIEENGGYPDLIHIDKMVEYAAQLPKPAMSLYAVIRAGIASEVALLDKTLPRPARRRGDPGSWHRLPPLEYPQLLT